MNVNSACAASSVFHSSFNIVWGRRADDNICHLKRGQKVLAAAGLANSAIKRRHNGLLLMSDDVSPPSPVTK